RAAALWWQQERWGDEGLPEFLVRQQVFLPDCLKTVDMIRKGVITYCDPKRIFGDHGHHRLREYSQRVGISGAAGLPSAPPPRSRISELRAWLAKRAESRSVATPPPTDTVTGSSAFGMPALPKVEPRAPSGGPTSSQFLRGGAAPPKPTPPPSSSLSGIRKSV